MILPHVTNEPTEGILARLQAEQLQLRERVITTDCVPFSFSATNPAHIEGLQLVGGVDISFLDEGFETAVAGLVVLAYPSFQVVHKELRPCRFTLPYIAGYLAFREAPVLNEMIQDLRRNHPEHVPQVIFVDGNGLLHPRGFGLASHLGVLADIPTIGVAKNFLAVDDGPSLTVNGVNTAFREQLARGIDRMPLVGESGRVWGMAVSATKTIRPIYVSVGHCVSLDTAVNLVARCCQFRIPEPIRVADQVTRQYIREHSHPPQK
ncbi:hypothetical protein IWQ62_000527 [Dispira parvispora]|uniref:Endonuclease V n=1 Tax=Dispira parvispora TaxID=1520584 RepID=A0A9W8B148_9FUNG|nr:hypothetical protein IWQ62_000527 [Dispira parvispora]